MLNLNHPDVRSENSLVLEGTDKLGCFANRGRSENNYMCRSRRGGVQTTYLDVSVGGLLINCASNIKGSNYSCSGDIFIPDFECLLCV